MKIIIFANDTTYTYNLRNEIIERLISDGHNVIIASKILLFEAELKALGCKLINIETDRHGTNPLADFKLLFTFSKILKDEKPDIALTYNIKPNVYGGLACRINAIPYFPNITGLGTAVEYPGIMQVITTRLYKAGIKKAECVFFQNTENRAFFINHRLLNPKSRTRLLPGSGVSLKNHKVIPYPKDEGTINFLFIARIMKEKGIDIYIQAAKKIYEEKHNVMFHICGRCDDDRYVAILQEAEKQGYIVYHGEQKNMIPYFEMSHCIVHPSYYPEGMSNVLLEAAAHCRPVIATDRAGCREIVDNNESGYIIPIKDENALIEALNKFLDMTWFQKQKMGLAGRRKIEREFDRKIVVNIYIEEIKKTQIQKVNK